MYMCGVVRAAVGPCPTVPDSSTSIIDASFFFLIAGEEPCPVTVNTRRRERMTFNIRAGFSHPASQRPPRDRHKPSMNQGAAAKAAEGA